MLKWLFNCSPAYASVISKQNLPGVVFGDPQGANCDDFVGYYIDTEKITHCPADMEPTGKDDPNVDL